MSANRPLAAAALFAALTMACAAASAQTMYRCGNQFQDKPCADGKGQVVEQKSAPAPAGAASSKARPAASSSSATRPKAANPTQALAQQCTRLREQAKHYPPRKREDVQAEMRQLGCAYPVDGGVEKEAACAVAQTGQQIAEACGTKRR